MVVLRPGHAALVVGAQFGDEGKGKLVDRLAADADWVCRMQGGNNAGHTLVIQGRKVVTHALPSGIVRPDCRVGIGAGVVLDPLSLKDEIEKLRGLGVPVTSDRVFIDGRAALILPSHRAQDRGRESSLATGAIGTTGRGIGPAYASRAHREAPRVIDLVTGNLESWRQRSPHLFEGWEGDDWQRLREVGEELRPFVTDVASQVNEALADGARVLLEGAQGVLLDNLFGTYPFVTSSQMHAGAAGGGLGVPPWKISPVIGVFKAYATRVGNGPFVGELHGDFAEALRQKGGEYGSTTGRPRRVGWLDLVALRYVTRLNGFTGLAITKGDVLSGFDSVGIITSYRSRSRGEPLATWPMRVEDWDDVEPVVEFRPGWTSVEDSRFEDFIAFVEGTVNVPVLYVSTGPGREEGHFRRTTR